MNKPKVKSLVWKKVGLETADNIILLFEGKIDFGTIGKFKAFQIWEFKSNPKKGKYHYELSTDYSKSLWFRSVEGAKIYAYAITRKLVLSLLDFGDDKQKESDKS